MFAMQAEHLNHSTRFCKEYLIEKIALSIETASCIKIVNKFRARIWNVPTHIIPENLP